MNRIAILTASAALLLGASGAALAGGQYGHDRMKHSATETKTQADIVDGVAASADHTTLVTAVKAAGLVETLKGEGPFTLFAPTNAAFDALPEGTVETLLKPENKAELTKILTYHVVPGALDSAAVVAAIKDGDGRATLTTVQGENLTAKIDANGDVIVTDARGGSSKVTKVDMRQSNGIIHVVDAVLMPSEPEV